MAARRHLSGNVDLLRQVMLRHEVKHKCSHLSWDFYVAIRPRHEMLSYPGAPQTEPTATNRPDKFISRPNALRVGRVMRGVRAANNKAMEKAVQYNGGANGSKPNKLRNDGTNIFLGSY